MNGAVDVQRHLWPWSVGNGDETFNLIYEPVTVPFYGSPVLSVSENATVLLSRRYERFQPFGRMTDLNAVYVGRELFPLFANRLLPKSRPEYRDFLSWLGVDEGSADELELLWRSGGERATDTLQVVHCPEPSPDGQYRAELCSHGIRHLPGELPRASAGGRRQ